MKEFKSFYKEVKGNEGGKCRYNKRLDTYGCGCAHDCSYCYAEIPVKLSGLVGRCRAVCGKLGEDRAQDCEA